MWTRSTCYEDRIRRSWDGGMDRSIGHRVMKCLRNTREGLISWDKLHFDHVRQRVKELEEQLQVLDKDPISPKDRQKGGH
ncbi:UNVERIFIED_CONTAM: hypothetical protein Slati_3735500 [Sesamum latifolium]|uniref:Uncharacterized protein n=1 Tax=Sesamum latifolium TaxID=2727402 RepID=A0AAW2U3P4_9LAMI